MKTEVERNSKREVLLPFFICTSQKEAVGVGPYMDAVAICAVDPDLPVYWQFQRIRVGKNVIGGNKVPGYRAHNVNHRHKQS